MAKNDCGDNWSGLRRRDGRLLCNEVFELKAAALALQFANASQVDVMMSVMQTAAAARNQRLIFHGEMHT